MALARATALTIAQLRARVRDELEDPSAEPNGTVRPDAQRRFSDAQIDKALNDQLIEMANKAAAGRPGLAILTETLSYSSGVTALPAAVQSNEIVLVEDITDPDVPSVVSYASPGELPFHRRPSDVGSYRYQQRRYTLTSTGTGDAIEVVPDGAVSLRISYMAPPVIFGAEDGSGTSDAHPLSPRWRELVFLGAAIKLARRDEDIKAAQQIQYDRMMDDYGKLAKRRKGPKFVQNIRKGI